MIGVVVVVEKKRRGAFSFFSRVPTSVMMGNEKQNWELVPSSGFYCIRSFLSAFATVYR